MNACILLTTLVTMITIEKVQGQSYHFSNGWNPGKRSMQEPVCHFRQDVQTLVLKLIEVSTLTKHTPFFFSCFKTVP
jgi:hypothetical protein